MGLEDQLEEIVRRVPEERRGPLTEGLARFLAVGVRTPGDLVRLARSPIESEDVRSSAVWMLGRIEDGLHAVDVSALLADETAPDGLRCEVAQTLMFTESEIAIAALRAALAHNIPPDVRCSAANALGLNRANASAIGDLVGILLDPTDDTEVRGYAAEALGHTFQMAVVPPEVTKALRTTVLDPDETVRYEAVWALGLIGRVKDIPLLERVLSEEKARRTPNATIVKETEDALGHLAERRRTRS